MNKTLTSMMATAVLATAVFSAREASAVPINGTIDFTGKVVATETSGNNVNVDFQSGAVVDVDLPYTPTGDYGSIPVNTAATFLDFSFNEITLALSPDPVNPIWSVQSGGLLYTFELTSLKIGDFSDLGVLKVEGYGIARITNLDGTDAGFDATEGTFRLGGGTSGGSGNRFTFSAGTAVPDGGATAALLGCSFLGLTYVRRRFGFVKA